MSRHEGVSCDSCLKGNFRGRRYKCLTCFDYDLCASCFEAGATTTRHTTEHPMQCILTRSDFELYYKGEGLSSEQSQSFTCPFCGRMGFTETAIQEHVNADHPDSTVEVVCPICAAQPGGDPNLVTEDFAGHLALEHRPTSRDLISFLDEPTGTRHNVRRLPHSTRGISGARTRRTNMHFNSGSISSLSPSGRDAVDPIAELLSQLSGVRRNNPTQGSASAQLQQLQMQLHLERQQVRAARQQLERLPRRQVHTSATAMTSGTASATVSSISNQVLTVSNVGVGGGGSSTPKTTETTGNSNATAHVQAHSQLMLTKCMDASLSEIELEAQEVERANRSIFLQDVLLNLLMISGDADADEPVQAIREHSVAPQICSSLQQQQSPSSSQIAAAAPAPASQSTHTQAAVTSATSDQCKNNGSSNAGCGGSSLSEQQPSLAKRSQRTSPNSKRKSAVATQQPQSRINASQNNNRNASIEYMLTSRPPQQQSTDSNGINVREVLMGSNYGSATDTARRKPICTVDSINQATGPPTSH